MFETILTIGFVFVTIGSFVYYEASRDGPYMLNYRPPSGSSALSLQRIVILTRPH